MNQTRKTDRSLIAMVLALVLMLTMMPVSASAVGTVSQNYDAVLAHIAENGVVDEELGYPFLGSYYEQDGMTVYFYLIDTGEGIMFQISMIGDESAPVFVDNMFTLKKSSDNLSTYFDIVILLSETEYDMVETTKVIDRTKVTTSREYNVTESGSQITSEMAQMMFNVSFQALCAYWDEYLGEMLGFGLRGLGFTNYDGYVCPHIYDNDCDPECNHCGDTRQTSHSYGNWEPGEAGCQKICTSCGDVQTAEHQWVKNENSVDATCKADGKDCFTCSVCGGEKEEVLPKTDDHSYGDWQEVDAELHSHQCSVCEKVEEAAHRWGAGVLTQPPTEEADGTVTYTCTDCGAEKYLSTADMIPGDIDGNFVVNRDDVVQLLLHVSMPNAFPIAVPADFNGDTNVNRDDVVQLLLHVSMPDAFPLN